MAGNEPAMTIAFSEIGETGSLDRARSVQPFTHFLAGLEERHRLLVDSYMGTGPWISAGPGRPVLDRKRAEPAQFDTVTFRHCVGDLAEDRVDDVLYVALIKMRILRGNSLDKL